MAEQQTWTHKGVRISFNPLSATFSATIAGRNERAPSLAAMRKKIDAQAASSFKPFSALVWTDWRDRDNTRYKRVTVTDVQREKIRNAGVRVMWLVGSQAYREVMPDTPKNEARIKAYVKRDVEVQKQITRLKDEVEALKDAIEIRPAE